MQTIPNKLFVPDAKNAVRPKFNWQVRNLYAAAQFIRDPGTFALMFTNRGDSTVEVNGKILYPGTVGVSLGDSFTIATAMSGYEFSGIVNVAFSGGTGTGNNLEVVELFYVD